MRNKKITPLLNKMKEILESQGFQYKNYIFNRNRLKFTDVITIQKATYFDHDKPEFTINVGIYIEEFVEILFENRNQVVKTEAECLVRCRLGDLIQGGELGSGTDMWWEADKDNLHVDIVGDAILQHAIPFFNRFKSYEDIAIFLRENKSALMKLPSNILVHAMVESSIGNTSFAVDLVDKIKAPSWQEKKSIVRSRITNQCKDMR